MKLTELSVDLDKVKCFVCKAATGNIETDGLLVPNRGVVPVVVDCVLDCGEGELRYKTPCTGVVFVCEHGCMDKFAEIPQPIVLRQKC